MMKHYQVVAAVIVHDEEILGVQKGKNAYPYLSYKYEFPGGKIEPGERAEEALLREIAEELQLPISIDYKIAVIHHQYPDFMVTLTTFYCHAASRELTLTEHISATWLPKEKLKQLDWAGADQPILPLL